MSRPESGDRAPAFSLQTDNGESVTLADFAGRALILYFYPKDETPGCTTEACEFRDNIFAYRKLNAQILGVSLDDVESHAKFAENHSLPFPILADTEGEVADAYGVRTRRFGFEMAKRETFLIDPEGKLAVHYSDVDPDTHSAEVLADLTARSAQAAGE